MSLPSVTFKICKGGRDPSGFVLIGWCGFLIEEEVSWGLLYAHDGVNSNTDIKCVSSNHPPPLRKSLSGHF